MYKNINVITKFFFVVFFRTREQIFSYRTNVRHQPDVCCGKLVSGRKNLVTGKFYFSRWSKSSLFLRETSTLLPSLISA